MNDGGGAKLGDFARPVGLPLRQDSNTDCKHRERLQNIAGAPRNRELGKVPVLWSLQSEKSSTHKQGQQNSS